MISIKPIRSSNLDVAASHIFSCSDRILPRFWQVPSMIRILKLSRSRISTAFLSLKLGQTLRDAPLGINEPIKGIFMFNDMIP